MTGRLAAQRDTTNHKNQTKADQVDSRHVECYYGGTGEQNLPVGSFDR